MLLDRFYLLMQVFINDHTQWYFSIMKKNFGFPPTAATPRNSVSNPIIKIINHVERWLKWRFMVILGYQLQFEKIPILVRLICMIKHYLCCGVARIDIKRDAEATKRLSRVAHSVSGGISPGC